MAYGYAQKEIKSEFKGYSNSSSKIYRVIEYTDGTYSCNCPAWIFHKGSRIDCKHILDIKNEQAQVVIQKVGTETSCENNNIKKLNTEVKHLT